MRPYGSHDTETGASGTSVTTQFLWCGLHICEKRSANDSAVTRYFPEGEIQNGQPLYYAQDQVGSVTALVNAQGNVVGRLKYDAYGNIVKQSGILPDFRYAGLYAQPGTGLYLATFRAYDPQTGRWLSRDPTGILGGINLYAYVENNPLNLVDPYGLWALSDLFKPEPLKPPTIGAPSPNTCVYPGETCSVRTKLGIAQCVLKRGVLFTQICVIQWYAWASSCLTGGVPQCKLKPKLGKYPNKINDKAGCSKNQ